MKNRFLILISIAASLFFISCVNSVEENPLNIFEEIPAVTTDTGTSAQTIHYATFQGTFNFEGAVPSEVLQLNQNELAQNEGARTAMPELPTGWKYYVEASAPGHSTKTYDFTVGVSSQNGKFTVNGNSYLLKDLEYTKDGITWTVELGIKKGDTKIMSDSNPFTLSEEVPVYVHDFLLKPVSGGTGTVKLEMKVPSKVKNVTANLSGLTCSAPDSDGKVTVTG